MVGFLGKASVVGKGIAGWWYTWVAGLIMTFFSLYSCLSIRFRVYIQAKGVRFADISQCILYIIPLHLHSPEDRPAAIRVLFLEYEDSL
jgi:hypothetical protein